MFRVRKGAVLTAALAAVTLVLAACGGSSSGGSSSSTQAKTLKLWHYEGANSAMGVAWAAAIKEFEQTHPNVTIKYEEKGFEQIRQTASMVLNSSNGPDILEYNKGNASAGLLSKQGLLTDMTSEVTKRGWDKLLPTSLQTTARYDAKGVMGSGNWYGIPNYGEYVEVYYNKDMFAKQGISVPTTLDEFTAAMDKFVKAGITPLSVGGAEYPAQQIFYELALSKANRAWVDDYQLYKNKIDFHGPELTYAANTFSDWVKKGYISKNAAGIKAEEMGTSFESGKFPILISGSWWYGRFASEIKKFQWGSFLWPGNTLNAGSSGNLWVIPKNSKNKDLAYDFIDITMKKDIQNKLGNGGGLPVNADASAITGDKNKELIQNFNTLLQNDGLAFYPDWPVTGYYDTLVSAVQKLINGSESPDKMLDEIAKPYNENLKSMGK